MLFSHQVFQNIFPKPISGHHCYLTMKPQTDGQKHGFGNINFPLSKMAVNIKMLRRFVDIGGVPTN